MSVQVTFQGVTYTVPEEDDSGWQDLTSYLVALSAAAVGTVDTKSYRVATATPAAVSTSDDYAVGINYAGASVVNLPAGTTGKIVVIYDASGNAANNPITVNGNGGQQINGRDDYVIRTNFGAVQLQFGTSDWKVLSSRDVTHEQNTTNFSVVDLAPTATNTGVDVADGESCTLTFLGNTCRFLIEADTTSLECACSAGNDAVDCLWDTDSLFLDSDAGTGIVVTKSGQTVTIKSRLGGNADIFLKVLVGQVSAATAWS
jgi:hypothetical protein